MQTLEDLDRWIAEAGEAGVVAVDTETTSLDAMQAELCGVSLAVEDRQSGAVRACYIPLGHRSGEDDMFGGGLVEGQMALDAALARLKPLLEDPSVLKVAQNLKYDWLVLSRYGIEVAPFDDTMLIAYALDAGRSRHGMDKLSETFLGHTPIAFKEVAGTGKAQVTFDHVPIEAATDYAAEDADVTLRLWRALKPRLAGEQVTSVYERLERPLVPVLARMEARGIKVDRQILSRLSGSFAQKAAGLEAEIRELAGIYGITPVPQRSIEGPILERGVLRFKEGDDNGPLQFVAQQRAEPQVTHATHQNFAIVAIARFACRDASLGGMLRNRRVQGGDDMCRWRESPLAGCSRAAN